jgi:hypothetical protein
MPVWFCEFRTTLSGKIEADTQQEAVRKFRQAIEALDLGVADIQDFRLDLTRAGYATEAEALDPKPRTRRAPPWGNSPSH